MPPSHRDDILLNHALLAGWPLSGDDGDKHDRGTALVVGGSAETPGAALLAGTAALHIGAGRLQIATGAKIATAVAVAMPEARVIPIDEAEAGPLAELLAAADAVVIGPGIDDIVASASFNGVNLVDGNLATADVVGSITRDTAGAIGTETITVTGVDLSAVGAVLTLADADLLDAAGIFPHEQVDVLNITNGARFTTYAIEAPRGSRVIGVNGVKGDITPNGDGDKIDTDSGVLLPLRLPRLLRLLGLLRGFVGGVSCRFSKSKS